MRFGGMTGDLYRSKKQGFFGSFSSIRFQLYTLITLFSVLLAGTILSTAIMIWDHAREEAQVAVVNYQRDLLLQTTWLVFDQPVEIENLSQIIQNFEQNQSALMVGGEGIVGDGVMLKLQAARNELIYDQLTAISVSWQTYRAQLIAINDLADNDPNRKLMLGKTQDQYFILVDQLNTVFSFIEKHMQEDHRELLIVQIILTVIAIPLFFWGGHIIRWRIVGPLKGLQEAAIHFGDGNFSNSIQMDNKDELGDLASAFEKMRSEISKDRIQLENQIAVRTHELSVAFEFSQEIVGQLDFDSLLAMITRKASTLMRAERAFLCLANPNDNTVEMYSDISGVRKGVRPRQQADLVKEVAIDGKVVIATVPDYACKFIQSESSKQCISVPLRSGDRIVGAICALRDRSDVIDENEKQAFALLANSAAIAIENVRLINEQEKQARQNAMSLERQRLASELHDNLIQILNLINLRVGQIRGLIVESPGRDFQAEFDLVTSNVTVAIEQVRMIMGDIVSPHQGESNMALRLEQDIRAFEDKTGLHVGVSGMGTYLDRLVSLSQKQLLMILNEALTNIHRHAEAEKVMIQFEEDQDKVLMTIEDNGRGFQTELDYGHHHYGLRIMRTRAERSGGSLIVESEPGQGTRIKASFPFRFQE